MGMFSKMFFGRALKCKNCGQKSDPRSDNWEVLGKWRGFVIMTCKKCGYGVRIGLFTEKLVDKESIDKMREIREKTN